jgi:hypothetical protein
MARADGPAHELAALPFQPARRPPALLGTVRHRILLVGLIERTPPSASRLALARSLDRSRCVVVAVVLEDGVVQGQHGYAQVGVRRAAPHSAASASSASMMV